MLQSHQAMKKFKQRKGMVGFAALATLLLWAGGNLIWDGIMHVGPGVWEFGSIESDMHEGADFRSELIPEKKYKRECYCSGSGLILFGVMISWEVIRAWNKRNELEKSWEQAIVSPTNLQVIKKYPELFQDDFIEWINKNHPDQEI
jgi:hypothetical protein